MRKWVCGLFAAALVSVCGLPVFAANAKNLPLTGLVYNEDGDNVTVDYDFTINGDGAVKAESVRPGKKYYIEINSQGTIDFLSGTPVPVSDLFESDDFSFKIDRDENCRYLSSVKFVHKRLGGSAREYYIEVGLKQSDLLDSEKITFDVFFKARRDETGRWNEGDTANVHFALWMENEREEGEDGYIDTGEGVVFEPVSNERNFVTWGADDEIATLEFDADDDARDFYGRLSTKIDRGIYEEYGDPADADLYFRTFVGNPKIDATSRGTLTLYNPYGEDTYDRGYRYSVAPRSCYIYLADSYGGLTDVTDRFTYVDGGRTEAGIDGWQARVRQLGSYVISDQDLLAYEEELPESVETLPERPAIQPGAPVPSAPTGSSDLLGSAAGLMFLAVMMIACTRVRK